MATWDPHPIVHWELTRRDRNELSTYEAYKTIDQIAAVRPRELILSGGDPLRRNDLAQIIDYARRRGLDPALVLTPTDELTRDALATLEKCGLTRVVFSIDGSTAAIHESVHAIRGTFGATLRAMNWARTLGLRIEVNTLVVRRNLGDLRAIAALIRPFDVVRWNVHFPVPIGASRALEMITAEEVERVFAILDDLRVQEAFALRVVEAPHYRRFRLQRMLASRLVPHGTPRDESARDAISISHAGDVRPSELAPQSAGNVRYRQLGVIYRGSDLLVALRDPDNLHGRCRHCEFRALCGGSRARAYAMTGDLFGADPLCAWEPAAQEAST